MPNYVHKKLVEYSHEKPKRAQYCPYAPSPVRYGKESNLTIPEEISPPATEDEKKYIQRVLGSFLYYARAIDLTILHAQSAITSEQAKPTKQTSAKYNIYWTTWPQIQMQWSDSTHQT